MFLFLIYWSYDFKVIKGIKILFRNPISLIFLAFIIIFIPIILFQSQSSISEIITSILTISIILFIYILIFSISFLKPKSLLIYASEKLTKTSSEKIKSRRFGKSEYYIQYYYSVLTYYKMITRRYRLTYQDDVLIRTKSQLIPLLCSQGLISNSQAKKELIKNLNSLSEIDPFNNPDEFTDKMTILENNILKDVCEDDAKSRIYNILRDKTGKEKIKEYLFYIITILSILSAIINTFFRDVILSIIQEMF